MTLDFEKSELKDIDGNCHQTGFIKRNLQNLIPKLLFPFFVTNYS